MPEEQLKGSIKGNIKFKTYNGTHITQLGICAVIIKIKKFKKNMCILCSSRKWPGAAQDARYNSAKHN